MIGDRDGTHRLSVMGRSKSISRFSVMWVTAIFALALGGCQSATPDSVPVSQEPLYATTDLVVEAYTSYGGDCEELLSIESSALFNGSSAMSCMGSTDDSLVSFTVFDTSKDPEKVVSSAVLNDPGLCLGRGFAAFFVDERRLQDFDFELGCTGVQPEPEKPNVSSGSIEGVVSGFTHWSEFKFGACYVERNKNLIRQAREVPCEEPHELEIFFVDSYDSDDESGLYPFASKACRAPFEKYVGLTEKESIFGYATYMADSKEFESGIRSISCGLIMGDDSSWLGSSKNSNR